MHLCLDPKLREDSWTITNVLGFVDKAATSVSYTLNLTIADLQYGNYYSNNLFY